MTVEDAELGEDDAEEDDAEEDEAEEDAVFFTGNDSPVMLLSSTKTVQVQTNEQTR